ncbi:hypothetical protein AA313_de0202171 [Arthrobotrys entomopaga]|nr:hypothetical protein AA313_de0202171 [Arthrobotrys entomopaga]
MCPYSNMTVSKPIAADYIDEADWGSMTTMQRSFYLQSLQPPRPPTPPPAFEPTLFFFYGTLTIPKVLKRILSLSEEPVLIKARTRFFKMKMWGPYPALTEYQDEDERGPVGGFAYEVKTEEHLRRLIAYEGANYTIRPLLIKLSGGEYEETDATYGKTFVWNGYPEELTDGEFNPEVFQQTSLQKTEEEEA